MVRRSSLYAWQLQYGLSTDTSIGSVPTESEASVGGNTGGNAGGSNPSPPVEGGGLSSLPAQADTSAVKVAFKGLSKTDILKQLGLNQPLGGDFVVRMNLTSVRYPPMVGRGDKLDEVVGTANNDYPIYNIGTGQTIIVHTSNKTPTDTYDKNKWFRDTTSGNDYPWRYVP